MVKIFVNFTSVNGSSPTVGNWNFKVCHFLEKKAAHSVKHVRSLCVLFVFFVVSHFVFEGGTLVFSAPGPKPLPFAFEKCSILAAI